jgi:hypothetical protein
MKIQFKADCAVKGTHYEQGEVADFDEGLANHLITLGRAQKPEAEGDKPAKAESKAKGK